MRDRLHLAILVPGGIGIDHHVPVLLDLLTRLSRSCDLRIYSFSDLDPHPALQGPACTVIRPPASCAAVLMKAAWFLHRIRKDHGLRPFDAVHGFWILLQGVVAVAAGRMLGIPSLVTLPGGDIADLPDIAYGSLSRPRNRPVVAWTLRHASHTVLLTRYQQDLMEAQALPLERISIIPYGVDLERFPFGPTPFAPPFQFLFIGNLNRVKDPFTLLGAFRDLAERFDCRLTVLGTDLLGGDVQALAQAWGLEGRIDWRGKVGHDQIPEALSRSHLLLMSSRFEGQSMAVLEAFAAGVPVVGTRVGILADRGEPDLTALPGDAAGLARIAGELLADPERVSALRDANRRYAEARSAAWTCQEYLNLYERLSRP
jgi:glycosyltransferase involved in cell wall biosynthesis